MHATRGRDARRQGRAAPGAASWRTVGAETSSPEPAQVADDALISPTWVLAPAAGLTPGFRRRRDRRTSVLTSRRCQRRSLVGVTRNDRQRDRGYSRLAAANKARSVAVSLRSSCLPTQDREFVPEHNDLELLELLRTATKQYELKHASEDQIAGRADQNQGSPLERKRLWVDRSCSAPVVWRLSRFRGERNVRWDRVLPAPCLKRGTRVRLRGSSP